MAYKVFVSYSASDRRLVHAIREAARPLGITVYSYDQDVRPGINLSEKLIRAIQSCDAVVVLLTAAGVASLAVHQEIGAARQAGKVIIPILEKGVDPTRITLLQGIEYDMLDHDNIGPTIIRLTGRLGALKLRSERAGWAIAAVVGGLFLWSNATDKDADEEDEDDWDEEEWDEEEGEEDD